MLIGIKKFLSMRYLLIVCMALMFFAGQFCLNISEAVASNVVASDKAKVVPIKVGSALPNSSLMTMDNKAITLHEAVQGKPAVLIVYRGSW